MKMLSEYDDEYSSEKERYTIYKSERNSERKKPSANSDLEHVESYQYEHTRARSTPVIGTGIVDLAEKVVVPTKEFPKYNFLGKILGPKGSTLKNIASSTKTRISILGRGSLKNSEEEEKLRNSTDPEHEHLKEALHVLIQVKAPCVVAHARMSAALKEINQYMTPPIGGGGYNNRNLSPLAAGGGPILRYGIPPPGAIIIGQPNAAVEDQLRQQISPRYNANAPKTNSTDSYKYSADTSGSNYDYTDNYRGGKKRSNIRSDYSTKKYREEKSYSKEKNHYMSSSYSSRN